MNKSMPILTLSHEDLDKLGLNDCLTEIVDDVKKALIDHSEGKTISDKVALIPTREKVFQVFDADDSIREKYSEVDLDQKLSSLNAINGRAASIKLVGGTALNKELGFPRSESLIVLYTNDTFRPVCMMRGTEISALRTGAYAAIIGEYLMPKETGNIVGYIGSGKMAETSIACMDASIADRIDEIKVYSKTPANRKRFVERMQPKTSMKLSVADSIEEAVNEADYVITATTALEPLVYDSQLQRNVTVLLLGGDEIGPDFLKRCSEKGLIFCDDWELVKHRNVQSLPLLYHNILNGNTSNGVRIQDSQIVNLGELLTGKFCPEPARYECVHVNCVGLPDLDLEVADRMYRKAREEKVGTYISL